MLRCPHPSTRHHHVHGQARPLLLLPMLSGTTSGRDLTRIQRVLLLLLLSVHNFTESEFLLPFNIINLIIQILNISVLLHTYA